MSKFIKENFFWFIFVFGSIILCFIGIADLFHWSFTDNFIFKLIIPLVLPLLLLIFHSFYILNIYRGLFLIVLAGSVGLFFEVIGLQYGTFFGGQYLYNKAMPAIFNVPYAVIIFWAFFIYTGYAISTSFLYWLRKDKPNKYNKKIFLLFLLVLFDGFIVTAIDFFMDPIQVNSGVWSWPQGGLYFGVPLGNFFGWFIVTIIVTSVFRLFEYFFPQKSPILKESFFLVPVIGYIILTFYYAVSAIYLGLYSLTIIGLFLMLPIPLINLFFWKRFRNLKNNIL